MTTGLTLGAYQVLEILGEGPLGTSLLAVERQSGARVVLRRLAPDLAALPALVDALREVAERLMDLRHPTLPRVLELLTLPDAPPCLVTEYQSGTSLLAYLERGEGASAEPLAVAEQLADALAAGQRRGLIHGALHPGKVLLVPDPVSGVASARLLDLGLGALLALVRELSPQRVPAPPEPLQEYLAPEMARGQGGDGPSDVYALGAILQRSLQAARITVSTAPTILPVQRQKAATLLHDLPELLRAMLLPTPAERPPMALVAEELRRVQGARASGNTPKVRVSVGQHIGDFRLLRQLGGGGMGVVFEASHDRLSRRAAIKVLRPELTSDPEMVRRFFNEAEAVNLVRHAGIVNVFEYGQLPDQTVYIIMEFLEGESLHRRMSRSEGRLGLEGLRLVRQVASALSAVHARGVIHRDLKPENIMVVADPEVPGGERAKVLDFGIAKMAVGGRGPEAEGPATQAGQTLGTPVYMAPEQSRDAGRVDDRADVYSLGVILYEVLVGRPPFWAATLSELLSQHLYATPRPVREVDPELAPAVEVLVARMLAKEPRQRPTMAQVADALDAVLAGAAGSPALAALLSSGTLALPAPSWRRLLVPGVVLVLGAVLLALALLLAQRSSRRDPPPPPSPPVVAQTPPALSAPTEPELPLLRAHALGVIQEALHDAEPPLRRRALQLLARSRDGRHAPLLLAHLTDPDPSVQAQAALGLGQLGSRAGEPALRALLRGRSINKQPWLAVAALRALRDLGVPPPLSQVKALARTRQPAARVQAQRLLAESGDRAARKWLLGAAADEEQLGSLGLLAREGDEPARAALKARWRAAEGDPALGLLAAAELARPHGGDEGDAEAQAFLSEAARGPAGLTSPKEGALAGRSLRAARLLAGLDDPWGCERFGAVFVEPQAALPERVLAAEGLGACGRRAGALTLAQHLAKERGPLRLRLAAAGAILQIAASDPQLLAQEALRRYENQLDDEQQLRRGDAVAALGDAEPRLSVPLLARAMADREAEVRERAAEALGRTRVRAAIPVLGAALDDEARGVRREALSSIGKVGQKLRQRGERVDDLVGTVAGRVDRGADEGERLVGVTALLALGDRSREQQLRAWLRAVDPEIRRHAIEAWGVDPQRDPAALRDALRDPVFAVRFAAAALLAARGLKDGVAVLQEALLGRGSDSLLAQGLLRQLGQSGVTGRTGGAARRLADEPLSARLLALTAAPRLRAAEALELLRQGARDASPEVRRQAVGTAAELLAAAPAPAVAAALWRTLRGLLLDSDEEVRLRAGLLWSRSGTAAPGAEGERPTARTAPRPARDLIRDAQEAYLRGRYQQTLELLRGQRGEDAQVLIGAVACRQRDTDAALAAHRGLQDPAARSYLEALCARAQVTLAPVAAAPAAPLPPRRSAAPPAAESEERPLTNRHINLPTRLFDGNVEIKD